MTSNMTSNMISKNSELDEIILLNDGQKIKEYILDKFSKKMAHKKQYHSTDQ